MKIFPYTKLIIIHLFLHSVTSAAWSCIFTSFLELVHMSFTSILVYPASLNQKMKTTKKPHIYSIILHLHVNISLTCLPGPEIENKKIPLPNIYSNVLHPDVLISLTAYTISLFFGVRKFIKRDLFIACILDEILSFENHKIAKN